MESEVELGLSWAGVKHLIDTAFRKPSFSEHAGSCICMF